MSDRASALSPGVTLAIDTATQIGIVGLGDASGAVLARDAWVANHFHGERLLVSIERVLARAGASLAELTGIIVGTGPGSFTGLRVGLATAKGLAFGLSVPLVGVETVVALADADASGGEHAARAATTVVLLPAGPAGRYRSVVETGDPANLRLADVPRYITGDGDVEAPPGARVLAVDVPGAPSAAREAGAHARDELAPALLRLGTRRLAAAQPAALAELVPVYVTPPRGSAALEGPIRWSRDPR